MKMTLLPVWLSRLLFPQQWADLERRSKVTGVARETKVVLRIGSFEVTRHRQVVDKNRK